MAGDELHALGHHGLYRAHHPALDTGHIGDQGAGAQQVAVLPHPIQEGGGVQPEDDPVRPGDQRFKVMVGTGTDIFLFQGPGHGGGVLVDAGDPVSFAGKNLGVFAAQQTQAHNEIGMTVIHPNVTHFPPDRSWRPESA